MIPGIAFIVSNLLKKAENSIGETTKMILFFLRCDWTLRILWQSRVVCSSAGDFCNHETLDRPHSRGQVCGSLIIFRIDSLFWQIYRRRFSPTEIYFLKWSFFRWLYWLDSMVKRRRKREISLFHTGKGENINSSTW